MPWPQRDPVRIVRPCCGASASVADLLRGAVRIPHRPTCPRR